MVQSALDPPDAGIRIDSVAVIPGGFEGGLNVAVYLVVAFGISGGVVSVLHLSSLPIPYTTHIYL